MSYGIQNRNTKKWVEVVNWNEDGTTWCSLADREVGGIWLKTNKDCLRFMREHKIPQEMYKPRRYEDDRLEIWYKANRERLLKQGYRERASTVHRPDGTLLYTK